jgi:hypothetical protein
MSLFSKFVNWVIVSGTCILPVAYGQTNIRVAIPFAFHIADKEFPSGEYLVKASSGQTVLLLQNRDHSRAQFVLTNAVEAPIPVEQPRFVFERYGTEYFLSTVWLPGGYTGRELPAGRRQMELAQKQASPDRTTLVARLATKKP